MNRFIKNLKILPRWIIILIDMGLFLFAVSLGYLLRFNFDLASIEANNYEVGIMLFVGAGLVSTLATGSYSGIIRYTGFEDAFRIIIMVTIAAAICAVANFTNHYLIGTYIIPFSTLVIAWMASAIFLISYRMLVKIVFSYYTRSSIKYSNALIFGAGKSGQITRQIFENAPNSSVRIIGYLEDDFNKVGKVLNGVKIYPANGDMVSLIESLHIKEMIISVQNLSVTRKSELVDTCIKLGIKVKHVPPVYRWTRGELSAGQIKEVKIEDLLGRESIKLNNYYVNKELKNKRIFITGAAGSIGSELVRQVALYSPSMIILLDQWESGLFDIENELVRSNPDCVIYSKILDITNERRLSAIFSEFKPDIVYHAAAYKHVPLMESNPSEAILCNVGGTKFMADLSVEFEVEKFVMVSTDKAVNPTNVMGASKRIAEMYVQALNNVEINAEGIRTRFVTTRFGNVLGSNGSVIPVFEEQIANGGPVTVTHPEITRFFMTIPEACQLVLEAGAMGKGGEIFIFDMGQSVKITDLAKKMIHLSGFQEGKDIDIIFTGLRDGEKLHEELLTHKENNTPTYHAKILIAKVEQVTFFKISREIDKLVELAQLNDEYKAVEMMKRIIPEFVSNSSRFEKLDKTRYSLDS
ncbi:MAG: polysaccharide biosynthesis protein [Bacteroidetes bacterium]|nr:polysaccharide biosynthesis protein [Bacteroidota bacterium]